MGVFNQFPYTNFHEVNLDWLIAKVKDLLDDWNEYKTEMDLWKLSVDEQLETFREWFDDLDVDEQVRQLINQMVRDGTLQQIISPMATTVTENWLSDNLDPSVLPVDATLSIEGAAADAKKTGYYVGGLASVNSCNYAFTDNQVTDMAGVHFSSKNGVVTFNGTATGLSTFTLYFSYTEFPLGMVKGRQYKIKKNGTGTHTGVIIQVYSIDGDRNLASIAAVSDSGIFTLPETAVGLLIRLRANTNVAVNGTVRPEIWYDDENTLAIKKLEATSARNLTPVRDLNVTEHGIHWITDASLVKASGTADSTSFVWLYNNQSAMPDWLEYNVDYFINYDPVRSTGGRFMVQIWTYTGSTLNLLLSTTETTRFNIPSGRGYTGLLIRCSVPTGMTIDNSAYISISKELTAAGLTKDAERIFSTKSVFFGDSIIIGRNGDSSSGEPDFVTSMPIPKYISKALNMECVNKGVSGSGYLTGTLAYDTISATNLSDVDYVFLNYGVNDGFKEIGTYNSTNENEVLGQFNKIINYIYDHYPSVNVVVFAPINGRNVGSFPKYWYGTVPTTARSRGILSARLKEACEYYNIPYVEQTKGPINGFTIQTLIGADGVHPSIEGYERLAGFYAGQLASIISEK